MTVFVSTAALALGALFLLSPARAAKTWGWKHMDDMTPRRKAAYLWGLRALGVSLTLSGILFAIDRTWGG